MSEINIFENALSDITALFDRHEISYMVIGGLANARWGRPRATLDIDITVWAPDRHINVQVNVDADHTEQLLQWLNEQGHAQQVTVQLPEQAHFQLRGDPVLVRRNADRAEDLRIVPMEDGQE